MAEPRTAALTCCVEDDDVMLEMQEPDVLTYSSTVLMLATLSVYPCRMPFITALYSHQAAWIGNVVVDSRDIEIIVSHIHKKTVTDDAAGRERYDSLALPRHAEQISIKKEMQAEAHVYVQSNPLYSALGVERD